MNQRTLKVSKSSVLTIAAVCLLAACKPGTPSRYIQPGEMEDILYDYHIGQAMAQLEEGPLEQRNFDRTVNMAAVLKKHGVTKAEFDSSLVYYYTRSDRFKDIYKHVAERLSDEALNLGASDGEIERYATLSMNGDTTNIWAGNRTAVLIPYAPDNRISFRQVADTTYRKGDSFEFNIMVDFLYQTGSKDAIVCLAAKLDNDSIVSRVNHVSVAGVNQLRLTIDDDLAVKELYGYIYLGKGNDQSSTLKLMFLKNIQLIRFHKQEVKAEAKPEVQTDDKPETAPETKELVKDSVRPESDDKKGMRQIKLENNNNDLKPKEL